MEFITAMQDPTIGTLNLTCSFLSACAASTHRSSGYYASRLREHLQQHGIDVSLTPSVRALVASTARKHADSVEREVARVDLLALADLLDSPSGLRVG